MDNCDVPAFKRKNLKFKPKIMAFSGKLAAEIYFDKKVYYGEHSQCLGDSRILALPSTSGMAQRYWNSKYWHTLAAHVAI